MDDEEAGPAATEPELDQALARAIRLFISGAAQADAGPAFTGE